MIKMSSVKMDKTQNDDKILKQRSKVFSNPFDKLSFKTTIQEDICKLLNKGNKEIVIESPPGTGKTIAGLYFIYYFQQPSIIFSTRIQVNSQWEEAAEKYLNCDIIFANSSYVFKQDMINEAMVIICTPSKYLNAVKNNFNFKRYTTALFDEAHNMLTPNKTPLFFYFNNNLLLSATIPPKSTQFLLKRFRLIHKPTMKDKMIEEIPVYFIETLKSEEKENGFYNILFNTPIILIFKTAAKILVTTRLIRDWIKEVTIMLKMLINRKKQNKPIPSIKFGLIRSATNNSYLFDTEDVDIEKVHDALQNFLLHPQINGTKCRQREIKRTLYEEIQDKQALDKYFMREIDICELEEKVGSLSNTVISLIDEYETIVENEDSPIVVKSLDKYLAGIFDQFPTVVKNKEIRNIIKQANIIVSTNSRMQEGFNCEELVMGYFNDFSYSYIVRTQLLGRIRRNQSNEHKEFLYKFPRIAYCTVNNSLINMISRQIHYLKRNLRFSDEDKLFNKKYEDFNYEQEFNECLKNNYIKLNDIKKEACYNKKHRFARNTNLQYYQEYNKIKGIGYNEVSTYIKKYLTQQGLPIEI